MVGIAWLYMIVRELAGRPEGCPWFLRTSQCSKIIKSRTEKIFRAALRVPVCVLVNNSIQA